MKKRLGYVSNSSSSSYMIWGENASKFCEGIGAGSKMELKYAADTIWYHKVCPWYPDKIREEYAHFLTNEDWKKKFQNNDRLVGFLPMSLLDLIPEKLKDYEDAFVIWFYENYGDIDFYEIEFSDHEGETKYMEFDMEDVMADYHDKEKISFSNH